MQYIIDRIENGYAICETPDRHMHSIAVSALPDGIAEGMVLAAQDRTYIIDQAATQRRRDTVEQKRRELFEQLPDV